MADPDAPSSKATAKDAPVDVRTVSGWQVPVVAGKAPTGDSSVGEFVARLHEEPVSALEDGALGTSLSRAQLDDVLVFCAERACEASGATCPNCRLRANALGHLSIKDFIADHAEIRLIAEDARIQGPGERTAAFEGFEAFQRDWAGQEVWFLARRVLRKLRHGLRRSGVNVAPLAGAGETPSVVLVEPQLADNIGMVARAMGNFGLDDLRLVAPRDGWPNEKARVAASGANAIIDAAAAHDAVTDAIADLNWVCATTARQRDLRKPVMTPQQAAEEMSRRIADGQRCGVLFGRESSGLASNDLVDADAIVMIPVNSRFASLNLAQAVLLLGYQFMLTTDRATLGRVTTYETPREAGVNLGGAQPATKSDLAGLFDHLEGALEAAGFFVPAHRKPTVMRNLRTMLTRMAPTAKEVRTLRGVVATLSRPPRQPS